MENSIGTIVNTPLCLHLLLERATEMRRKARAEWLNIRDSLTLEENASYMDSFATLDEQRRRLREELKGYERLIEASLN